MKSLFVKQILPVLAAAAACLLLASFFMFNTQKTPLPVQGEVYNWQYIWSAGNPAPSEGTVFKHANQDFRVMRSFGQQYLYLKTAVPAQDSARQLTVFTAFNPVEIRLNGTPLANTGYGTAFFAPTEEVTVEIPAMADDAVLEVYLHAPYHFSFRAALSQGEPQALLAPHSIALTIGAAVGLVGLFMLVLSVVLSPGYMNFGKMLGLSLLALLTGIFIMLPNLSVWGVQGFYATYPLMVATAACMLFISTWIIRQGLPHRSGIFISFLLAAGSFGAMLLPLPFQYGFLSLGILFVLFTFIKGVKALAHMVAEKTIGARLVLFSYSLFAFSMLALFLGQVMPSPMAAKEVLALFGGVMVLVFFTVFVRRAVIGKIRQDERERQSYLDVLWINRLVSVCGRVLAQSEPLAFCREAALGLRELLTIESKEKGGVCAAMKTEGGFAEILREGPSACQYGVVARNMQAHKEEIYYGTTYLDACLHYNKDMLAVIHIEGLVNGISEKARVIADIALANMRTGLDNLQLKTDMLHTQESVFINLAEIAELKSEGSREHLMRVAEYTSLLAGAMGITGHEREILTLASLVHDIGKLAIPEHLIAKKGKLTNDEFTIVKEHVAYGYNMLSQTRGEFMQAAAVIAQQHHEWYDGSGYLGLSGQQIHLYARIVTVADVLDALTTKRSYKEAWPFFQAAEYIVGQAGTQFDPAVIRAFTEVRPEIESAYRTDFGLAE